MLIYRQWTNGTSQHGDLGDDHALFWGTFDELMGYVEPDYDEALRELRRRSANVEPRFENQELIAFLSQLYDKDDGRMRVSYAYMDPRLGSESFACEFDEKLRRRGVLKFCQLKKKQRRPGAVR